MTAEEWLAAHHAEQAEEDRHREIRDEYDLHDADESAAQNVCVRGPVAEYDIRATSAAEPNERVDHAQRRRVPTPDETTAAVTRAQAALAEIAARQRADAAREAAEAEEVARRAELARWNHDEQTTQGAHTRQRADEPALEG